MIGSRPAVMHGNAIKTSGGLMKKDLKYNKQGRIVSKKKSMQAKKDNRLEWLRVNIKKNKKELLVKKYSKQGSGMISSIVFADGILEIPENVSQILKGQFYKFYAFERLFN